MSSMDDTGYLDAPKSTYSPISKKSNGEKSSINQTSVKIKDEFIRSGQQPNATNKNGLANDETDDVNSFKKSFTNSNHDLINSSNNKSSKDKFDVYSMPSTRLLSDQEKKFCNTIKLRPSQYLNLKTMILKVSV